MLNLHDLFFRSYPMNGFTIEHLSAEVWSSILTFCIPDLKTTRVVLRTTLEIHKDGCGMEDDHLFHTRALDNYFG